jgi:hypothetical protein
LPCAGARNYLYFFIGSIGIELLIADSEEPLPGRLNLYLHALAATRNIPCPAAGWHEKNKYRASFSRKHINFLPPI